MPKRRPMFAMPSRIANYLRVIKHRISRGLITLPITVYINPEGTKVSTKNYTKWIPLVQVASTEDIAFDVLAYEVALIRSRHESPSSGL